MKAVRAYTYKLQDSDESLLMVVADTGTHVSFKTNTVVYKGDDLSICIPADDEWIASCTNIQPVELPDKEEV